MTLEEAQQRILDLEAELETVTTERDTLSQNNSELSASLENARELNQRLFERANVAKASGVDTEDEEDEAPTCEEFAKTINLF